MYFAYSIISMLIIFILPYSLTKCINPKAKYNQNMAVIGFIMAALYAFNHGV